MLIKLIYKNFNIKNFFIYFFGSVLSVIVFFTLISLMFVNEGIELGDGRENIEAAFSFYYVLVGIMAVMFMNFVFSYYMRTKMKQLGLLSVLGAKKRTLLLMILGEYWVIYLISCIIGIIVGVTITQILLWVLKQFGTFTVLTFVQYQSIIYSTLKISGLVFIFGLVGISISILLKRNLSELLHYDIKRERKYRVAGIVGVSGIGLIIWSFFNLKEYSVWKMIISIVVCLLGLYLFLTFTGSLLLTLYKKVFYRNYIKNILAINEFFYRYKSNKRVIFITFTLHFLVLFFANAFVASAISMDEQYVASLYPHDYVIFETAPGADDTGLLYDMGSQIIEARKGYWDNEGGFVLCISQSSYQDLTDEWIEVADGEAVVFSQMDEDLYSNNTAISMMDEGEAQLVIKEQRRDILIGHGQDAVAVMTDREFELLDREQMQHIIWGQGALDQSEQETLKQLENNPEIQVIIKSELMKAYQRSRVIEIISAVFIGLFSSLCCAGVLGIKVYSEFENNKVKQEILRNLGITKKQRNKAISKELILLMIMPMIGAALLAWVFVKADMQGEKDLIFDMSFLVFQFACILVQILYYFIIRYRLIKNIETYLE